MIALTLAEIADALGGRIVRGDPAMTVDGNVETDSRLVSAGSVFFALPGETTDGALFAPHAAEAGATVVIAERELALPAPEGDAALIVVPDGVAALAALARLVVARVRALGRLKVVAITGSNGKTTTKNLLRAILE
ncbi:MAG TPA: Mur ligase domain-containing protein, partial [Pseudolysinimonas sp.]|nr:Mur ligase domain-containing protein [Pseudolysinimonas sp.]